MSDETDFEIATSPGSFAREGLFQPHEADQATHDGTGRVTLTYSVQGAKDTPPAERKVRVPTGVTVFDAASWNGIAI
ncbi:MAG: hypothetical protein ACR2FG_01820, partial [Marmoricola sp.]